LKQIAQRISLMKVIVQLKRKLIAQRISQVKLIVHLSKLHCTHNTQKTIA